MSPILSRRVFLRLGCCAAAGLACSTSNLGLLNALAESEDDYKALVCIFLFGGNDSNNTIIPLDARFEQYQDIRGSLALPESSLLPIAAPDGTPYGLPPQFPEIQKLYKENAAAFLINVGNLVQPINRGQYLSGGFGVLANLFAHDQQQGEWQTGVSDVNTQPIGWGGKLAETLLKSGMSGGAIPTCVSVAETSIFLTGKNTLQMSVAPLVVASLAGPGGVAGAARDAAQQALFKFDSGLSLVQAANRMSSQGFESEQVLTNALTHAPALRTSFPKTQVGSQLEQVAQIIQVRSTLGASRQIFFCSIGGFDTHFYQFRPLPPLISELSQGLGAFYSAIVELGVESQVTAFTASEFNRSFQANTSIGSDHAWGGHQLIVGGAVKGGKLYGEFPRFVLSDDDDAGDRGAWIPGIASAQYSATLASWFGVSRAALPILFPDLPNFTEWNLRFLG
jgi:uncharacterized protein (DUF1501 family)